MARRFDCPLIGGDTTTWSGPLVITVTMFSRPGPTAPVRRTGAQVGRYHHGHRPSWRIVVFGPPPAIHSARQRGSGSDRGQVPLHAMLDISDGLAGDLRHILTASGIGAVLDAWKIPVHPDARDSAADPLAAALGDGEDYELLFCVSGDDARRLEQCPALHGSAHNSHRHHYCSEPPAGKGHLFLRSDAVAPAGPSGPAGLRAHIAPPDDRAVYHIFSSITPV